MFAPLLAGVHTFLKKTFELLFAELGNNWFMGNMDEILGKNIKKGWTKIDFQGTIYHLFPYKEHKNPGRLPETYITVGV